MILAAGKMQMETSDQDYKITESSMDGKGKLWVQLSHTTISTTSGFLSPPLPQESLTTKYRGEIKAREQV